MKYSREQRQLLAKFWILLHEREFKTAKYNPKTRKRTIRYPKTQFAKEFDISVDTLNRILEEYFAAK